MNTQSRGFGIPLSVQKVGRITGLFTLLGPVIGGAVFFVGSSIIGLISGPQIDSIPGPQPHPAEFQTITAMVFVTVAFVVLFSYLLGLLPAALAGIIIGTAQIKFGQLPWTLVLLIGAAVGACDVIIQERLLSLLPGARIKPPSPSLLGAGILCITCIIATLVCWRVVRNWYTEQPSLSSNA